MFDLPMMAAVAVCVLIAWARDRRAAGDEE